MRIFSQLRAGCIPIAAKSAILFLVALSLLLVAVGCNSIHVGSIENATQSTEAAESVADNDYYSAELNAEPPAEAALTNDVQRYFPNWPNYTVYEDHVYVSEELGLTFEFPVEWVGHFEIIPSERLREDDGWHYRYYEGFGIYAVPRPDLWHELDALTGYPMLTGFVGGFIRMSRVEFDEGLEVLYSDISNMPKVMLWNIGDTVLIFTSSHDVQHDNATIGINDMIIDGITSGEVVFY